MPPISRLQIKPPNTHIHIHVDCANMNIMKSVGSWMLCLLLVTTTQADEYCEDFEDGGLGAFWTAGHDSGGHWKASSYSELKQKIPDFPEPASGDGIVYLTLSHGSSYVSAAMEMVSEYSFSDGSSMQFRYWLRSMYTGSGFLSVKRVVGGQVNDTILDLTRKSGPNVDEWKEAKVEIPSSDQKFKVWPNVL